LSRRVSLPAADHLFRPTSAPPGPAPVEAGEAGGEADEESVGGRKPSGRVRHDEKMTVYVTSDELLDLEHARLLLRRSHGLAVDRGRVVREAIAIALADFEQNGERSVIVQRLSES
jgi:hypothetical protein